MISLSCCRGFQCCKEMASVSIHMISKNGGKAMSNTKGHKGVDVYLCFEDNLRTQVSSFELFFISSASECKFK